ncbi:MAG: hypothetical protein HY779_03540 [Rubrobacteridae bacterium]|nr:hypothetical protein [Rubrobacteridae bacterium]
MPDHKLPAKFIKKIQGKDFVLFEGLLEMAHGEGLKRVETQLLQIPRDDNGMLAIVSAVVETEKGVFSALGDASPGSAEPPMRPHLVRLADTRAIARAMRIAVNVGMTAVEEMNVSNNDQETEHETVDNSDWLKHPETVILSFGKHTDKTLGEILVEDPAYVEWLAKEAYDNMLRKAAKRLLSVCGMNETGKNDLDSFELDSTA